MASAQTVARASDALRMLRERFRETSAGTIALLEDLARQLGADPSDPETIAALRRELHRVHGTAGSYGFIEASRLAGKLERRVIEWEKDKVVWQEYLTNVLKKRGAEWRPLFTACAEHNS